MSSVLKTCRCSTQIRGSWSSPSRTAAPSDAARSARSYPSSISLRTTWSRYGTLARAAVAARSAGCWYARGEIRSSFQATSGLYRPSMAGRIIVGTSSWADPGFVKEWYPPKMPAAERLPWYAERFEAVELNSSFYAVPERSTVSRWCEVTPEGFVFDVKLHRLLSRHSAGLDSLPPDLRGEARTTARGRVELTSELESELLRETLRAI